MVKKMFDFDAIWKGYSKEDEFIARDTILLELLIEKGVITLEEVREKYSHLENKIEEVKNQRRKAIEEKVKELKGEKDV